MEEPRGDVLPLAEMMLGLLVTASRYGNSALRAAAYPARVVAPDRVDATQRRLALTGRRAAGRGRNVLTDAAGGAFDDPELRRLVDEGLERLLTGPELERLIERIAASPAVRAVIARQTISYWDELRGLLRTRLATLDDRVTSAIRSLLRRPPVAGPYGGLAARGFALVLDLALVAFVVTTGGAAVGLVASLGGAHGPAWLVGTVAGGVWLLFANAYLIAFWTVGQTPGMRLLGLHVRDGSGRPPTLGRAALRAFGLWLAIVPLFAGLVPVAVDGRRRGLHDLLAGTTVAYEEAAFTQAG